MQNHEPIWFNREDESVNLPKQSIFVGTPCHSEVSIHYTQSVLELQKYCMQNKINVMFQLFKSSLVTQGRNLCVSAFLQSKCTHLLFVDSDICFKPESAKHLLDSDKDVISIPYPLKDMCWDKALTYMKEDKIKTVEDLSSKAFNRYPMRVPKADHITLNNNCIEVTHSSTGFMMIKRSVFDKMKKKYPNKVINQDTLINGKLQKTPEMWNFFDTLHNPEDKTYLGEDFAFCKLWKDIGGKCHAYINDYITHVGEHSYTGKFADELIMDK
jgi:hypothetical protein